MANLPEHSGAAFDAVRRIETNDPVLGGPSEIDGIVNSPYNFALQALVNRTIWLKEALEALVIPAPVPNASTTTAGKVRLATLPEARAGTDAVTAVTPQGVRAAIQDIDLVNISVPNASTSRPGIIEIATQTEANAFTDMNRALVPGVMPGLLSAIHFPGKLSVSSPATAGWLTSDGTPISSEAELSDVQHYIWQIAASSKLHLITAKLAFLQGCNDNKYKIEIDPKLPDVDWVFFDADLVYHPECDPTRSTRSSGKHDHDHDNTYCYSYKMKNTKMKRTRTHSHILSKNVTDYIERAKLVRRLESDTDGENLPIKLWRVDYTSDRRAIFNIIILAVEF